MTLRPLPTPTWWALFCVALSALGLVWFPLSVLQLVDGLLFQRTGAEILRDIALAWPLVAVPAAALATVTALVTVALRMTRVRESAAAFVAWCVLLAPLAWMCTWQGGRTVWLWAKVSLGLDGALPAWLRLTAVALLVATLGWLLARRAHRVLDATVHQLAALRTPTLLLLALCLAATLAQPPALLGSRTPPRGALPPGPLPPDIVLITVDTVAAADANVCGPGESYMPRLRRFAAGAWCFSRHYAASNFTTPTTSTLESGALPWSHLAAQPDAKMLPGTTRGALAERLRERGYFTVSLSDNLLASPRSRGTHPGWDRADLVRTNLFGNTVRETMSVFADTALPQIAATAWAFTGALDVWWHGEHNPFVSERAYARSSEVLAGHDARAPLFLWTHTLPPHAPYLPPPETKGRLLPRGELERWKDQVSDNLAYPAAQQAHIDKHRLRYRESMLAADAALGRFLDELAASGRLERSIVVVTADHGESFERGFIGHAGPHLHDALVRIPFVLRLPGQREGRIVEAPMSQADVAVTLADLAGAPAPAHAEGRSWKPMLDGATNWPDTPVFTMSLEHQNRFRPIEGGRFAVIDGRYKLWTTLGREPSRLYDVLADPAESRDIAAAQPERVARLEALVRERLARAESLRPARLNAAP